MEKRERVSACHGDSTRGSQIPSDLRVDTLELDGVEYVVFRYASTPAPAEPAARAAPSAPQSEFTDAEREVAQLLRGDMSNAAIAAQRRTSLGTVAKQIASVYRKRGVTSRREFRALYPDPSKR